MLIHRRTNLNQLPALFSFAIGRRNVGGVSHANPFLEVATFQLPTYLSIPSLWLFSGSLFSTFRPIGLCYCQTLVRWNSVARNRGS